MMHGNGLGETRRRVGGAVVAATMALAAVGCGTPGAMGNGTFYYECDGAGEADVACTGWSSPAIPDRIAVDAPFQIKFELHRSQIQAGIDEASIVVEPASLLRTAKDGAAFRLLEPGTHSLIAHTGDGRAIDYVHVEGRSVSAVDIVADLPFDADQLLLSVGQIAWVVATAEDEQGVDLAGRLTFGWQSADVQIASLEDGAYQRRRGIRAEAPGTTLVGVTVGGVTRDLSVQVQP